MVAAAGLGTAIAVDGSMLHMVNHMLYKALLFMCVGAVIYVTGTGNLHELHHGEEKYPPVWQAMPLVTLGALVGALAISGFPPFNGFVSKYLIKNAMYGMEPMETMLLIASVGTPLSFCKLLYFGFFNARAPIYRAVPKTLLFAILTVAAMCFIFGIQPQLLSDLLPYGTSLQVYSFTSVVEATLFVFSGILVFVLLNKVLERGIKVPAWFSIEQLVYKPISRVTMKVFCRAGNYLDKSVNSLYLKSGKVFLRICEMVMKFDNLIDDLYVKGGSTAYRLAEKSRHIDGSIDDAYHAAGSTAYQLAKKSRHIDGSIDEAYYAAGHMASQAIGRKEINEMTSEEIEELVQSDQGKYEKGKKRVFPTQKEPVQWSIKNLNFDNFLMALVLGVIMIIIFYFGMYK